MKIQELIDRGFLVRATSDAHKGWTDEEILSNGDTGGSVIYQPPKGTVLKLIDDDGGFIVNVTRVRPYIYYFSETVTGDPNEPDFWFLVIEGRQNAICRILDCPVEVEVYKRSLVLP